MYYWFDIGNLSIKGLWSGQEKLSRRTEPETNGNDCLKKSGWGQNRPKIV